MTLRVIGAGLGRTGTMSLKLALEQLLDQPCYHMIEVRSRAHVDAWKQAAHDRGAGWTRADWDELFAGFGAVVDWPAAPFWRELAAAYPEALILHSTRADAATWFASASATIFERDGGVDDAFYDMWDAVSSLTFDGDERVEAIAIAGYERHNADVLAMAPPERLVHYQPGDGWAPLCTALGLELPDTPFPHVNSTEAFRERRKQRRSERAQGETG